MEFVDQAEVLSVLSEMGMTQEEDGDLARLSMKDDDETVHLHIHTDGSVDAHEGARSIEVAKGEMPAMLEHLLHLLRMSQVVLMPVGKWRNVFDAVAFSLAENEDWQEFEHTATVALNGRDPLLCDAADFNLLVSLVRALFSDGEGESQTLLITSATAPFIIEIVPDGAMRLTLGSHVLADEVADAFEAHQ